MGEERCSASTPAGAPCRVTCVECVSEREEGERERERECVCVREREQQQQGADDLARGAGARPSDREERLRRVRLHLMQIES